MFEQREQNYAQKHMTLYIEEIKHKLLEITIIVNDSKKM